MRSFSDTSLANLPEPRSVEEVVAIAVALDREAERRYSAFAHQLRTIGSPAVAALLEELGGEHATRAGRLEAKMTTGQRQGIAANDLARLLPGMLAENGAAACDLFGLTPYGVLAFAVGLAQQTFRLYSYLAAAEDSRVRGCAEQLAGEELSRAARLRVERRRAYHAERRQPKADAYPVARLVESHADLLAAALAIEDRLAQRLAKAGATESNFSSTCQATRQRVAELRRAAEQAGEPGRPLAEELAEFSRSAPAKARAVRNGNVPARHLLAECERAFTFYDAVASAAPDEAVMLLAQDLSRAAVERIRQVRASADAPDEAGRGDGKP
jgi:hypothetical protein